MKKIISSLLTLLFITVVYAQQPNYHAEELEVVANLGEYQAIGVSVSSDNRLFVSFPRRGGEYKYGLTEVINGKLIPFPEESWNVMDSDEKNTFVSIQDLYVDAKQNLWVLDSKPSSDGSQGKFKLIKIDLKTNKVDKTYFFEDLDKTQSALNDIRVDTEKNLAYLSDPGQAAIVVLDLENGKINLRLSKTKYTLANDSIVLNYEGYEMRDTDRKPFISNVNGIALTMDNKYFYFKPINAYKLYRIETRFLANASLTNSELANKVEDMGNTVITHGLEADNNGNIYLTSSVDYSIKYLSPNGVLHTLVQDKRILWPDSLGIGSDGYLYFSCAQLQNEASWNEGINRTQYPYQIYRVKLPK